MEEREKMDFARHFFVEGFWVEKVYKRESLEMKIML